MATRSSKLPPHLGGQKAGNVDTGIVQAIRDHYGIETLVDIGCGDGAATKQYAAMGLVVLGIDGDWTRLPKDDWRFICHDFTTGPLDIGPPEYFHALFDLAYSIEFLEHVEERFIPNFMPLFAACRYAVVTAAPPGQKGYHHVNCRPPEYWHDVFADYGFAYDAAFSAHLREISTMTKVRPPLAGKRGTIFKRRGMFFAKT